MTQGQERGNGRAQKIRDHLQVHRNGVSVRELIIAIEPGCKVTNMAGSAGTLEGAGKIRSEIRGGVRVYFPTDSLNVDARATPKSKTTAHREALKAERGQHIRRIATKTTKPLAVAAPSEPRRPPLRSITLGAPPYLRELDREQIAEDVRRFEAKGGKVQRLKPGETAESLRHKAEQKVAFGRNSEIPKHRHRTQRAA